MGLGLFAVILSLCAIVSIYELGKSIFCSKVGLIAAFIYSLSSIISFYDRRFWNPMLLPALTTLTLLSVHKISKGNLRYWLVLGIALALGFSVHGLAIVLVLFSIIFLFNKITINRWFLIGLTIFLVSFLPLLIFEAKHSFVQAKGLVNSKSIGYAKFNTSQVFTFLSNGFSAVYHYDGSSNVKYLYTNNCHSYPQVSGSTAAKLLVLAVFVLLAFKSLFDIRYRYFSVFIFLNALVLAFWQESWSWYYLLPSTVPLVIVTGAFLSTIQRRSKLIIFVVLALFGLINLLIISTTFHQYSYSAKIMQAKIIGTVTHDYPFELKVNNSDSCQNYGYRYLFTYLQKEPAGSYIDSTLGWLYEDRIPKSRPAIEATIIDGEINFKKLPL